MSKSLIGLIDEACDRFASRDCFAFGGERVTYAAVEEGSRRIASGLIGAGFAPGMRAAVFSPNDPWAFVATLGIVRAGGIWAPVNPRNALDDNLALLAAFGCDAIFFHSRFAAAAKRISAQHPALKAAIQIDGELHPWMAAQTLRADYPVAAATDIVMIPMTGGTTGLPKAVALSNRNLLAIVEGVAALEPEPPVNLAAAPMTHVGGRIVFTVMVRGGVSVVLDGLDPDAVFDAIETHRVTDLFVPPTALYALLEHPRVHTADLTSLRRIAYGSAPISIEKLKAALRTFGPVLVGGFGQTEAPLLISRLKAEDHFVDGEIAPDERLRSVGRATPFSQLAIMADDGALLPPGEAGEIVVKGDFVCEGYFQNPEATAEMRRNGWHLTGDIGVIDDDGFLTIVDRRKDMIVTGGFNVYSAEVERVISAIPGVRDCVVIGVPDEKWGESVKAVVQPDVGVALNPLAIVAECKARLGPVKAPKSIDFVDDFPRSANGKVLKKQVRDRYWAGLDRRI